MFNDSWNYYQLACSRGRCEIVQYLDEVCEYLHLCLDKEGNNPLHIAAMANSDDGIRTMQYLIEKYQNPIILQMNFSNLNIIEICQKNKCDKTLEFLINNGIDKVFQYKANSSSKPKQTPSMVSQTNENQNQKLNEEYQNIFKELQDKIKRRERKIISLRREKESLTQENKELQTQVESLSQVNKELQTQVESLTQVNKELQTQVESLTQKNKELQTQAKSLTQEKEVLQTQVTQPVESKPSKRRRRSVRGKSVTSRSRIKELELVDNGNNEAPKTEKTRKRKLQSQNIINPENSDDLIRKK